MIAKSAIALISDYLTTIGLITRPSIEDGVLYVGMTIMIRIENDKAAVYQHQQGDCGSMGRGVGMVPLADPKLGDKILNICLVTE